VEEPSSEFGGSSRWFVVGLLVWVRAGPKAKKWIEDMGQGHPLDFEAGFEFSMGCGSTSGLQQPEVTKTVDLGAGLSSPISVGLSAMTSSGLSVLTSVEFSFLLKTPVLV
jgi:hypothetical protein